MGDTNNQRAQNFENGFTTKAIDKVNFSGQSPQNVKLLESIKEVVTASAKDLYGRQDDPKYIYIVNLIMKRVKQTLSDMNVSDSLDDIKESIAGSIDAKQLGSLTDDVAKLLSEYNDERKKGFDELKEYLKLSEAKTPAAENASNEDGNEQLIEDISDDIEERLKENVLPIFQKTISTATTKSDNVLMSTFKQLDDKIGGINTNIKKFNATTEQQFNQTNKAIDTNIKKIHSTFSNSKAAKVHQDAMHGFDKTVNSVSSLVKSVSLQQGTIKNINDNIKQVAKTVKNQDSSKLQKATIDRIDKNTRLVVSSVKKAKNEKTQKDVLDNIYKTVSKITPKTEHILKTLDAKNKKKLTTHFKSVDKAMEEVYGKSIQITHNIRGMNDSVVERFKDAYHSTKKLFGKVKDKIVDNAKSIFKKTTKKLNRMTSTIMAGIATMGAVMSSAFSMVMGPIGLMLKFVFMGLKLVLKPLQWVLKLFKNPLLLVLLLGGTLFILYKFFRPTFDKIIDKVKKAWDTVYRIWNDKIKPAVDVMMNILGDDSIPLGKRIIKAFKEGGKVLYHNFFPKGIGHFFKEMMTDHVWPFIKEHVIPFLQDHWKGILTALGLWYLIKNPFGAIGLILKLVKLGAGTLKLLPGLVKGGLGAAKVAGGLVGKLGMALVGMGPVGWAAIGVAAIAGGAIYYWYKKQRDAELAEAKKHEERYLANKKKDEATRKLLNRMYSTQEATWNQFGKVLDKLGVEKIEDKTPELYVLQDGTKLDKAAFDKYIEEQSGKSSYATSVENDIDLDKLNEFGFNGGDGDNKFNIVGHYFAKAKLAVESTRSFLKSYVSDRANHIGDPALPARFKQAIDRLNGIQKVAYSQIKAKYNEKRDTAYGKGSDEDWTDQLSHVVDRVLGNEIKTILNDFLTLPDGKINLGVSGQQVADKIMSDVTDLASSRNATLIKNALKSSEPAVDAYASSFGRIYENAANDALKSLNDQIGTNFFGLSKQSTLGKEYREKLEDLVRNAQRNSIATTGKALSADKLKELQTGAIKQIYGELRERLEQNPNSAEAASIKEAMAQLEKQDYIKTEVEKLQMQKSFLETTMKSKAASDELEGLDTNKMNEAIRTAMGNLYDDNKIKNFDSLNAEQQKLLLDEVQKALEADKKTSAAEIKDMKDALGKILSNTEETKKKAAGTTTVVQQNNIGTGGAQNAANASQTTSSRLPTQ